jgi:hypothetical protein
LGRFQSKSGALNSGVGDGNRTRNVRSHSPVLCQLSYSHRVLAIITTGAENCEWVVGGATVFVLRARSFGTASLRMTAGIRESRRRSAAAYADVFEAHGAQADGVEQVFGIHDQRTAEHLFYAAEVEATKLRPAGADD